MSEEMANGDPWRINWKKACQPKRAMETWWSIPKMFWTNLVQQIVME